VILLPVVFVALNMGFEIFPEDKFVEGIQEYLYPGMAQLPMFTGALEHTVVSAPALITSGI
jgi:hypothetical protein